VPLRLGELWRFRELLYFLTWRDIKVRYKQTFLGAAWAILQPLLTMVVFSLFFGRLAKVPSQGIPYPAFSYAGLIPWTFFAYGLQQASSSLVGNTNLITKVYFPRLAVPTASVIAGVVDAGMAFVVLVGIMAYFGLTPTAGVLLLPVFLLLALVSCLGVGLWLAALNVVYRDVRYVVPFLVQLWLFATPIAYPSTLLSPGWRLVYSINPMVGVVDGFRWGLVGTAPPLAGMIVVSGVTAVGILVSGAFYFRRLERTFADLI
jgi:lipopolysaccharide transport system permease protein